MAKVFGVVFLAIGVLGFVPGVTTNDHLLGIFHVNGVHNVIHLASGAVALACGLTSWRASRIYFQVFGVIYALVTVLGLIVGDGEILGLVANNMSDVILHLVISGTALYLGFGPYGREEDSRTTAA